MPKVRQRNLNNLQKINGKQVGLNTLNNQPKINGKQVGLKKSIKVKRNPKIIRAIISVLVLGSLAIMNRFHQTNRAKRRGPLNNHADKNEYVPIFKRCKYVGNPVVLSRFEDLFYSEDNFIFSRYLIEKRHVDDRFNTLKPFVRSSLEREKKKLKY